MGGLDRSLESKFRRVDSPFFLSRTFRFCKMASGDGSRRLVAILSRNYGHIVGEICRPRVLRGFMRAR